MVSLALCVNPALVMTLSREYIEIVYTWTSDKNSKFRRCEVLSRANHEILTSRHHVYIPSVPSVALFARFVVRTLFFLAFYRQLLQVLSTYLLVVCKRAAPLAAEPKTRHWWWQTDREVNISAEVTRLCFSGRPHLSNGRVISMVVVRRLSVCNG